MHIEVSGVHDARADERHGLPGIGRGAATACREAWVDRAREEGPARVLLRAVRWCAGRCGRTPRRLPRSPWEPHADRTSFPSRASLCSLGTRRQTAQDAPASSRARACDDARLRPAAWRTLLPSSMARLLSVKYYSSNCSSNTLQAQSSLSVVRWRRSRQRRERTLIPCDHGTPPHISCKNEQGTRGAQHMDEFDLDTSM